MFFYAKLFYVIVILLLVTSFSSYATIYINGTQSHFILMDQNTTVKLNNTIKTFCPSLLVKENGQNLSSGIYTYDDAGFFLCEAFETFDHGPGDIDFALTTTSFVYNLWLSKHHLLNIDTTSGNSIINGETHFIHCARETQENTGVDPMIFVDGGNKVEFQNIVFKDFSPLYLDIQNDSSIVFGDGTTLEITDNTKVSSNLTLTFDGKTIINGFGGELDLTNREHALDILSSSTLTIKNCRLKGFNIRCMGTDSTLTLSNCIIDLDNNYSFNNGHLEIYQDVSIIGENIFTFESSKPMRVHEHSKLHVDFNTTFSYGAPANNLLFMSDSTSYISLQGATIHVAPIGLELLRGTLLIDHIVNFEGINNSSSKIVFGNNTEIDNINIEFLPGGNIELTQGYLTYNNKS